MNYDSQSFKGESIELSSNRFHGCTFERCKLVYRGDISPTMEKCEIRKHLFAGLREWKAAATRADRILRLLQLAFILPHLAMSLINRECLVLGLIPLALADGRARVPPALRPYRIAIQHD